MARYKHQKAHHELLAVVLAVGGIGAAFAFGVSAVNLRPAPVSLSLMTLPPTALTAKAAVIYDPASGRVLYQKNANEPLPLASLTKLMSATVALQKNPPDKPIEITQADLAPEGDWGLKVGETLTLDQLLRLSLIASSNDAITAVAASAGSNYIDLMNKQAAAQGLTETHFYNPTGLDVSTESAGAYGSAYDVARLAAAFYKTYPQYFELTTQDEAVVSVEDGTLQAAATALPLFAIPGLIGAKTGYTDLAGGNLVAAFDIEVGHPLIAAVLGSTEEGRFDDIKTLIEAARQQLQP